MKTKITKFKRFYDLDKEIAYINDMNRQGWKLVYIKMGSFYTFVKSESDEYVTMYHATEKENVSGVMAFAAKCGYESIPHTLDGMGDLIYLTGKKGEVSDEFVTDNRAKIMVNKRIIKKFNLVSILYIILLCFLSLEFMFLSVAIGFAAYKTGSNVIMATAIPMIFIFLMIVLVLILLIKVLIVRSRIKRKIDDLTDSLNIYE